MWGVEMSTSRGARKDGAGDPVHLPVLPFRVLELILAPERFPRGGWIVDGTLGGGSHTSLILEAEPGVRVLGLDQDPEILEHAERRLAAFGERARLRRARLSQLPQLLEAEGIDRPIGMLIDLGVSSLQLDRAERGFSFQSDGVLDMRMDPSRERTAADIVNGWDESDLADLLYHEGGEKQARKIARAIVEARRRTPFQRTMPLADWIESTVGRSGRLHPATRSFLAIRRAVNEESEELLSALSTAQACLADGGRLVAISFHSAEDAQVKRFLKEGKREGSWRPLTPRPLRPDAEEVRANRRSRSAVLRAAERLRPLQEGEEG